MNSEDRKIVEGMLSRTDFGYLGGNAIKEEIACRKIMKNLIFLKVFDSTTTVKINDAKGNRRTCLEELSDILEVALKHTDKDRDLVIMRHVFWIEDQQKK